ncbi:ADP-glucose phosphorylase-like [Chenopodium quinoa]|uniref:Galactose-1-phosphate uridyl transferase N-terminal domain-containing protein n=1 Tax=Chenopodium quinoa TaxID=63459 RepID=A0A803MCA9_CHEQI|nr:ADP-glucose phosphorylase-like [Chenopodium quinoa]
MASQKPPSSLPQNPELRKDKINNKWVVFSPARSKRPSDFKSKSPVSDPNQNQSQTCPFCIGHERKCAPEIFRVLDDSDSYSNWRIRVIQNLYPALSRDIQPHNPGLLNPDCGVVPGFGFHDVVIETTTHPVHLSDLPGSGVGEVLMAYRKRVLQIASFDGIQYIQVFKNHGASAGASMSHSHSQIIALPIVPPSVSTRLAAMKEHFEQTGNCILCEKLPKELLIYESRHFVSVVPYAASYAFEIWIIPQFHSAHFHDIDKEKADDLGGLLKLMLEKMALQLNNPPFNYMIHTSPLRIDDSQLSCSHWFLQIVPQLTVLAGFEIATGCHINPVFPEDAAKILREVDVEDTEQIFKEVNVEDSEIPKEV